MTARYRSNTPRFIDETIDGEALIMDMVKGNYYSCVGASALAWNALKHGVSVPELSETMVTTYGVTLSDASADVERFVGRLLSEEMLVETGDTSLPSAEPEPTPEGVVVPGEYVALGLERYTDLADLILLDPVHDVTEAGWPHPSS